MFGQADVHQKVTGEIVVLAVPYPAVADVIAKRSEQLAGKVVVDITNPLNFATFDSLTVAADGSAAAEIAAELPQSRVLKAFNTTFAGTVAAGTVRVADHPDPSTALDIQEGAGYPRRPGRKENYTNGEVLP